MVSFNSRLSCISPYIGRIFTCADGDAVIRTFARRVSGLMPRAGFAENRCPVHSNGKLRFNIRINTEDEINGTVKWVV